MRYRTHAAFLITVLLFGGPALAAAEETDPQGDGEQSETYLGPDESWIRITGRAVETGAETFMLDYQDGKAFVEVDSEGPSFANTEILDGDWVTVYGKVDKGTFETTTIEAERIYAQRLEKWVYASAEDEEKRDLELGVRTYEPTSPALSAVSITGTVREVEEEQFTLSTGGGELTVDTSELNYDALDDRGVQQLEPGKLVTVTGIPANRTLKSRHLNARYIIEMRSPVFPELTGE